MLLIPHPKGWGYCRAYAIRPYNNGTKYNIFPTNSTGSKFISRQENYFFPISREYLPLLLFCPTISLN